jgi:MFS family permease
MIGPKAGTVESKATVARCEDAGIAGSAPSMLPSPRDRLLVTALLCALFAIMYVDRINISAAAGLIQTRFHLSNTQMGLVFSAFSWAYLASVMFGGLGARKYGARLTLLVSVTIVGLGTVATGLIGGLAGLIVARLVVGLGEGPVFPAATQAMRDWYPARRFGFIQGITHSASRLGFTIAPPLVAAIIHWSSWRLSFIVCGVAGMIWAFFWWRHFLDDPLTDSSIGAPRRSVTDRLTPAPFRALTIRMAPVTLVMFTYGWSYWVFVSWLPLYFTHQHGADLSQSAWLSSVPFFAGFIGNMAGGVASDIVLARTGRRRLARCGVVAISLAGAALFLLASLFAKDLTTVVALLAASMFFLELTIAPIYAIPMDISKEYAGLGSAYIIMGVALAGIVSPIVFGRLIDLTHDWNVPLATGVAILLTGAVAIGLVRPDEPLVTPTPL